MQKDHKIKEIEEKRLAHLSELTSKWLIYAEAKNTALIVGNTFALFKVLTLVDNPHAVPIVFHVGVLCLAFATALAFGAVLPLTKYLKPDIDRESTCELNPFSSKHLIQHSPKSLLRRLEITPDSNYELEFAEYLIGTAKLIIRKYTLFKYGSLVTLVGMVILSLFKLLY
ncbi:MAG: hypothetical protein O3A01_06615 [bacterium]|nr:hypothetical protein [bacterium]